MEFTKSVLAEELEILDKIDNVKSISNKKFSIIASNDVRGDIFDFAVKSNNKILTIKEIERSMEDVFRSLTK